ncbi:TPA: hypothetical protein ACKE3D_005068, partial [Burkholderia dolosa]
IGRIGACTGECVARACRQRADVVDRFRSGTRGRERAGRELTTHSISPHGALRPTPRDGSTTAVATAPSRAAS